MGIILKRIIYDLRVKNNVKEYFLRLRFYIVINPLASPSAGAPALKYGDVNTVTPSLGEVKWLIKTQIY